MTSPLHVPLLLRITAVLVITLVLITGVVSAHEQREVEGYTFVVGFLNEPAVANELNGLSLRIESGEEGVEGLDATLQAEAIFGEETRALELRPAFGDPGHYQAEFIPIEDGTYSFRVFGMLDGIEINETFTGGPDTFSEVEARDVLLFPSDVASDAAESVSDAQDTADTAQTLGIIGLVVGGLALIVGIMAIVLSRRQPTGSAGAPEATA